MIGISSGGHYQQGKVNRLSFKQSQQPHLSDSAQRFYEQYRMTLPGEKAKKIITNTILLAVGVVASVFLVKQFSSKFGGVSLRAKIEQLVSANTISEESMNEFFSLLSQKIKKHGGSLPAASIKKMNENGSLSNLEIIANKLPKERVILQQGAEKKVEEIRIEYLKGLSKKTNSRKGSPKKVLQSFLKHCKKKLPPSI